MKYGNKKVIYNGMKFDSKLECDRYKVLEKKQEVGEITDLKRQVTFELLPQMKIDGKVRFRAKSYVADFTYYTKDGEYIVEDSKGFKTDVYKLKAHLMFYMYGLEIKETTRADLGA